MKGDWHILASGAEAIKTCVRDPEDIFQWAHQIDKIFFYFLLPFPLVAQHAATNINLFYFTLIFFYLIGGKWPFLKNTNF